MPLESIPRLLADCQAGGYAIGYFESWNLESLQGVLDAAEQTRSPIIVGFNGEFLSLDSRLAAERLALYGALGKAAAESSSVPCGLIFNECPVDSWVLAATEAGFNLVMPADPSCSYDDYLDRVKRIVVHAHTRHVAVEAELGELPCGAAGHVEHAGQLTDPHLAERFVRETGVDLLAVSVGNVHIHVSGELDLNLEHLSDTLRARARSAGAAWRNRNHRAIAASRHSARRRQGELRHVPQTAISHRPARNVRSPGASEQSA